MIKKKSRNGSVKWVDALTLHMYATPMKTAMTAAMNKGASVSMNYFKGSNTQGQWRLVDLESSGAK